VIHVKLFNLAYNCISTKVMNGDWDSGRPEEFENIFVKIS